MISSGLRRDFQRLGQEVREKSVCPEAVAGKDVPGDMILGRGPRLGQDLGSQVWHRSGRDHLA